MSEFPIEIDLKFQKKKIRYQDLKTNKQARENTHFF